MIAMEYGKSKLTVPASATNATASLLYRLVITESVGNRRFPTSSLATYGNVDPVGFEVLFLTLVLDETRVGLFGVRLATSEGPYAYVINS